MEKEGRNSLKWMYATSLSKNSGNKNRFSLANLIFPSYSNQELQDVLPNASIKHIQTQLLNLSETLCPEDNGLLAEHQ